MGAVREILSTVRLPKSSLLSVTAVAAACLVPLGTNPTPARALCNEGVCGVIQATCTLSNGTITTRWCTGSACPKIEGQNYTCGSCPIMMGDLVVGCGCMCFACSNCLPVDP